MKICLQEAIESLHLYKEESQACQDESNHHDTEQELLLVQEKFKRMEVIFTLRRNEGYMSSSFGGRSFPVIRLADENLVGVLKIKPCNSTSTCNKFLMFE